MLVKTLSTLVLVLLPYLNGENTKFSWFPREARELYILRVRSSMDSFKASRAFRVSSAEQHFMMRSERAESCRRIMFGVKSGVFHPN